MILFIDTTDFNSVTYALEKGSGAVFKKVFKANPHESHEVFGHLEKFLSAVALAKAGLTINSSKITKIIVNKGPGSYTGTRIGVTHALALGFAWNVPVKAVGTEEFTRLLAGTPKR